jgi:hypothetical protein
MIAELGHYALVLARGQDRHKAADRKEERQGG